MLRSVHHVLEGCVHLHSPGKQNQEERFLLRDQLTGLQGLGIPSPQGRLEPREEHNPSSVKALAHWVSPSHIMDDNLLLLCGPLMVNIDHIYPTAPGVLISI